MQKSRKLLPPGEAGENESSLATIASRTGVVIGRGEDEFLKHDLNLPKRCLKGSPAGLVSIKAKKLPEGFGYYYSVK
jgi:hypothetical protein